MEDSCKFGLALARRLPRSSLELAAELTPEVETIRCDLPVCPKKSHSPRVACESCVSMSTSCSRLLLPSPNDAPSILDLSLLRGQRPPQSLYSQSINDATMAALPRSRDAAKANTTALANGSIRARRPRSIHHSSRWKGESHTALKE
jgi:hypothetical protein